MNWLFDFVSRFIPTDTRTITRLYVISISVVITELLLALAFANFKARQVGDSAHYINVAAEQSMLSQRILLSTLWLQMNGEAEAAETILADIAQFDALRHELLTDAVVPETIFEGLTQIDGSQSANQIFQEFVRRARANVEAPSLDGIETWAVFVRTDVLPRAEAIADAFEEEAALNLRRLHQAWTNSIILAALILGLEAIFVFLPSQRLIQRTIREKEQKADDLQFANQLLEAKQEKLLVANAEADALRQEQAEFTYALSHDMKAPINSIRMLRAELSEILQTHPDPDVEMFLSLLSSTTSRMSELVEAVLDYTTTLGDTRELVEVDLNEVCQGIVEDLRGDISAANGVVELGALPKVRGCPSQLRMLFQNLVANGIKFRAAEKDSRIRIGCLEEQTSTVDLEVSDNGIGIAKANQDRIFGLFNRLHLRDEYPGTGLGLALCRRIIANHSGTISVNSVLGEGSQFIIRLPKGNTA